MGHVKRLSIYAAVILPVLLLAWAGIQLAQLKSGFAEVRPGSSLAEITRLLGQPKWVRECVHWGGPSPDGCVRDLGFIAFGIY
jgi:hypothetical protein